jgi:hypothetical protein
MSFVQRFSYSVWSFYTVWNYRRLIAKAEKSIEALRKFTAGNHTKYPYSMVVASLQKSIVEGQERIALVTGSSSYTEYCRKFHERETQKLMDAADSAMKEASDFLAGLGSDFEDLLRDAQ